MGCGARCKCAARCGALFRNTRILAEHLRRREKRGEPAAGQLGVGVLVGCWGVDHTRGPGTTVVGVYGGRVRIIPHSPQFSLMSVSQLISMEIHLSTKGLYGLFWTMSLSWSLAGALFFPPHRRPPHRHPPQSRPADSSSVS